MARLFLHVGCTKTGTTSIQAALTASRALLAERGFHYPAETDRHLTANLALDTPNGTAHIRPGRPFDQGFSEVLADIPDLGQGDLLISGELLSLALGRPGSGAALDRIARQAGFDSVHILLFVRDALPHFVSQWQQHVRGIAAYAHPIEDRFDAAGEVARISATLLEEVAPFPQIHVTAHSYDRPPADVLACTEDWLGLPRGTLIRPPRAARNRSMTRSETELVRSVHALGDHQTSIGQVLVHEVFDVPGDPVGLSEADQDALAARLAPTLDRVNALLPAGVDIRPGRVPVPAADAPYVFTDAQLDVIAAQLAGGLERRYRKGPLPGDTHAPPLDRPVPAPAPPPARTAAPRKRSLVRRALRPFDMRRWVRWARKTLGGSERDMK